MGTPALRALRESFPESEIHILVHSKRKELLQENPHVDRILGYRDNGVCRAILFFKTFRSPYDTILIFHANDDVWKILKILRYRVCYNRQGFAAEDRSVFSLGSLPKHSVQKRLALVQRAGGKESSDTRYEYSVPPSRVRWASEQWNKWGLSPEERMVGMQLGAADSFKTWPVESFVEVARHLRLQGVKIYLNASPAERKLTRRFLDLAGSGGIFFNPEKTLSHSAALIQRCSFFITPDTGPMHLALALGVPVIGLFCPTELERHGAAGVRKGAGHPQAEDLRALRPAGVPRQRVHEADYRGGSLPGRGTDAQGGFSGGRGPVVKIAMYNLTTTCRFGGWKLSSGKFPGSWPGAAKRCTSSPGGERSSARSRGSVCGSFLSGRGRSSPTWAGGFAKASRGAGKSGSAGAEDLGSRSRTIG